MLEAELTPAQRELAAGWYGYGRWRAPFWFVGMEPADDDIDACVRMWNALRRDELLDITAYREPTDKDWFSDGATKPQKTWEKLIWVVLAYHGLPATPAAVLDYQKNRLGRVDGETALIELSSIPAKTIVEERPRTLYRERRIETLRRRLSDAVRFVVFYSDSEEYRTSWNAIAGAPLAPREPVRIGSTAFAIMPHPQKERAKEPWLELGRQLHDLSPP